MLENPVSAPARTIRVASFHLPLACPVPGEKVQALHPRVFLDVERTGDATCPYCNTRYVLTDQKAESGHHGQHTA